MSNEAHPNDLQRRVRELTASDPYLPVPLYGQRHEALMSHLHERVSVRLTVEPEDSHPSDAGFGADASDAILREYEYGNDWAWGVAHLRVSYLGLEASEYLRQVSYASEQDFRDSSGYYEDMLEDAVSDLATQFLTESKAHLEIAEFLRR